ncbi:MATE family efflux transporter [Sneathia sanguinegens]|uniref:MATE family efflux transporter n=1 Tax=Sneathia sanguinegens TaxID=40543 RepID=UPI00258AA52F|nr:MATE family efflux transporter [Sneathia sanguinegens]MDU4652758.1 MATE family efflux transporter [Sneathia sanguinegens]MDU7497421.1 MATE family efflux transporter [Sneathia sanguinegens]
MWKSVFKLAIPVAIQSIMFSLFNIFDQIMVGTLGTTAVVSVGLGAKIFFILLFTMIGLTGGLGILSAQLIGSEQTEKISKIQGMTMFAGSVLVLVFVILSMVFPRFCMTLFTNDEKVISLGIKYHRAIALGYIPFFLNIIYVTILRNAKIVKIPLYATIVGLGVNTLFNYILIFGKFGFPKLGVLGAGIATTSSQTISCIILLSIVYGKKLIGSYSIKELLQFLTFDKDILLYWKLTLPTLVENISFIATDSISNSIYGYMGTKQTIAVTIMFPIQGAIIGFFSGFSTASSVLVGNYLGKNEKEKAYIISKKILILASVAPLIVGCIYLLFNNLYLTIFKLSPYSLEMTKKVMYFMVIFAPIKIFNMTITNGALTAGGETKFVLYQSIIGSWVFAVPMGYISAFILHFPIYYVFVSISFAEILRACLCYYKYMNKSWLNNLVS